MAGFYEGLRDDTAAALIERFGRSATLRQQVGTYDPATGKQANVNTDTAVKIVTLPMSKAKDVFSEELIATFDQFVIMSAKETAVANVEPSTNNILLINGDLTRILGLTPVSPAGIPVIYKIGLARS